MDRLRNDTREAHIQEMEVKTDLLSEREVARTEALRRNSETDNMLKALFSNRLFIGALAFFVLCVGGSLLYQQHVERQTAMSIEERIKAIEDGVIQPPEGYRYVWADPGVLRLDENGNPILLREGEPFFEIVPCIGFAPTREEFRQYQQLQQDKVDAIKRGDDAEIDRLSQALRRFYEEHRGEIPSIAASGGTRGVDYTEETRKLLYAAYIEAGFDYLVPDEYR